MVYVGVGPLVIVVYQLIEPQLRLLRQAGLQRGRQEARALAYGTFPTLLRSNRSLDDFKYDI